MSDDQRRAVIQYVKEYHEEYGEVPSVKNICKEIPLHFPDFGKLYADKLKKLFPGGIRGIAEASGVPVPLDRIDGTQKARLRREQPPEPAQIESARVYLNDVQTRRLFGISHLENSKDPSLILDELLERDEVIRGFKLDLGQELSLYRNCQTLRGISPKNMGALLTLVYELNRRGWDIAEFMGELQDSTSMLSITIRYLNNEISEKEALEGLMLG